MSGLVYFLYRYFDPNLQRWINRDPIAEWGGINLYAFVFNAVTGCVDALGLSSIFYPGIPSSPGNPFDPSLPRPPSLTLPGDPPPFPTLPPTPPFQYDNSPPLQYPDPSEGNDNGGGSYCPWTPTMATPQPSPWSIDPNFSGRLKSNGKFSWGLGVKWNWGGRPDPMRPDGGPFLPFPGSAGKLQPK